MSTGGPTVPLNCTLTSKQSLSLIALTYGVFPGVDCGGPCTIQELKAIGRQFNDETTVLQVELDGEPVRYLNGRVVNWFRHRNVSPVFSGFALPGNVFDDPFNLVGPYGPAVADGFNGIMTPLTLGNHTLRLLVVVGDPAAPLFEGESIFNIMVVTP